MAETRLSPTDLARIDRGLDELVMPSFEEMRALVAEIRLLRVEHARLAARHLALAAAMDTAQTALTNALREAAA